MGKYRSRIAVKSMVNILVLLVAFTVIMCAIGYAAFTEAMMFRYVDGGIRILEVAKTDIEPDKLEYYLESGGDGEGYAQMWERLNLLCNGSGATFIYIIRPDTETYDTVTYYLSTVNWNTSYSPYPVGYVKATTNDEYREKYRALMEGETDSDWLYLGGMNYSADLHHITVILPLKGSDGEVKALLNVQRQITDLVETRNHYVLEVILTTFVLFWVTLLLNGQVQRRTLLMPIEKITHEAVRFARENVANPVKLTDSIKSRDEIGLLAHSIDEMEEQVTDYTQSLKRVTAEKERMNTELNLAERIQAGMLPRVFPPFPERGEFDIYASMDPAREVGGDLYDFFLIDEDHLCLEIGDVSGKGIPAALFMMAAKILLENKVKSGSSPAEILAEVNNAICANNPEDMFITVWLGILEISTGKLTAVNAGHEYPVLRQPDGSYELLKDKHGFVLGSMENLKFKEYELKLEPGASIFVYTDGLPEAMDEGNNMFGTGRMLDALNIEPDAAPQRTLENVRTAVDDFVKGAEQFDDLTMLCLQYRGTKHSGQL